MRGHGRDGAGLQRGVWLGIASININGSHITQGAVKVNDTYFSTVQYNTPAWRNLVMCQEVGHTLGLDHQDEDFANAPLGTCMDYSNDPNPNHHPTPTTTTSWSASTATSTPPPRSVRRAGERWRRGRQLGGLLGNAR